MTKNILQHEEQSMNAQLSWRSLAARFAECLRDERGTAMTEYVLVSGVALPLAIYLFHPDNGFYKGARDQYELTTLLLMFPGP